MQHFCHKLWKAKKSRLGLCALFLTTITALLLALGGAPKEESADGRLLASGALKGLTIAIDAGHGGNDGGARARDSGIWEKEINLKVALKAEAALAGLGAKVVMTRREDKCLDMKKRADLRARMDMAQQGSAQLLVSIHMNEYRSRRESGPQVFYQKGGEKGRLLAGALQQALIDHLDPPKQRVAMAGNYYILRGTLPSALVECGFLSNAEEEKLLLSDEYQQKIANAIAKGVCEWWGLQKAAKSGETTPP